MSEVILDLAKIVRTYKQGENALNVLNGLDLNIKEGEIVALVGPSGSGKTTLLQIAGLLDQPTSGNVTICGEPMQSAGDNERTKSRRKRLGFVYQFHHLLPEFSALENIMLPQMIAGLDKKFSAEKAQSLLESLGLGPRANHRPAKLSGGEQQRVAIARALANAPRLLLADEPTGNLDPQTAEQVFALLLNTVRERKVAALIATHNLELAKRMDRVVKLEGGVLK